MSARQDIRHALKGYQDIKREMEICQKYGQDYRNQKGLKATIIDRLHPRQLELTVSEIITENDNTKTLRLTASGRALPAFLPGQYLSVSVQIDGVRTSRPYSISSSPTQTAYYDLTVGRVKDGFVSNYLLDEVKVGDTFTTSGPLGNFYYNPLFHGRKLVFLAGGTGITPFMSMIRTFTDQNLDLDILLLYGCRSVKDALFLPELAQRVERHPNFRFELVLSEPDSNDQGRRGLIDANLIKELVDDIAGTTFYICGPSAMQKFCTSQLESLGVKRRAIRREAFTAPGDVFDDPAWPQDVSADQPVTLYVQHPSGETVTIKTRVGEPVLTTLEKAGLIVPSACRTGECSMCRVKMTAGEVFQPSSALVRQSDRLLGYIHTCRAYPLSDLTLVIQ
ncbi:MAG TPA: FAD-binding oxidoreductase [Syntrophomonadaceae bacterium]|nr:FAD-binding oxidoreductase [Syntrophomonadaceae bacterium]HQA08013.1 FAD-binding oxidoreductase [Syntrophomonadaceae bacterium]HQE23805.1 FAD-binding oxidoreductase [Syntrophomonadaceae bacterium]